MRVSGRGGFVEFGGGKGEGVGLLAFREGAVVEVIDGVGF